MKDKDEYDDFDDVPEGTNPAAIDDLDNVIDNVEEAIEEEIEEVVIPVKKVNYLNNKELLKEIHRSKNSFSEYTHYKYSDYDVIVEKKDDIFLQEVQDRARAGRAARMAQQAYEQALANAAKNEKVKLADFKFDPATLKLEELVFRVLTFEHIPLAPGRKKNPKSTADHYVKLNFAPFKHFVIDDKGEAVEVGQSHTKKGQFSMEHGSITNKLAKMFILLVNKYAQRSNWRSYTYLDEMKGQALLQLAQMGLQFDEVRSDNPFSYYTQSLQNSFTRVVLLEKKNQDLRDDLLIDSGASPSFSRQLAIENEIRLLRSDAQDQDRD